MAETTGQEQDLTESSTRTTTSYLLFMRIMSERRTWLYLFVLVCSILLSSSWKLLKSVLNWYELQYTASSSSSSSSPSRLQAVYASVVLGGTCGILSMAPAMAAAVPAMVVVWISVVVLLAFFGKPRRVLVVEARKITGEVLGFVLKVVLMEGKFVAAICAVVGYFLLVSSS